MYFIQENQSKTFIFQANPSNLLKAIQFIIHYFKYFSGLNFANFILKYISFIAYYII